MTDYKPSPGIQRVLDHVAATEWCIEPTNGLFRTAKEGFCPLRSLTGSAHYEDAAVALFGLTKEDVELVMDAADDCPGHRRRLIRAALLRAARLEGGK